MAWPLFAIVRNQQSLTMIINGLARRRWFQIESIQQDVDYYIESNQEADFEENEFIYDELDLEDAPTNLRMDALTSSPSEGDTDATGLGTAPSSNHSGSPSPSSGASTHSKVGVLWMLWHPELHLCLPSLCKQLFWFVLKRFLSGLNTVAIWTKACYYLD